MEKKKKERRLELEISQSKLAKLCGISQSKISDYERGAHVPREKLIFKNSYRRMLVKTAINYRIRQEAEALAEGLGIAVEDVLRIWEEG